ncbi:MAG: aminotransferase class I/II-fold pyridoxal phosphate-dependent enzyme [Lentimicrobiaceae bacterium]|jgi:histidinol-phosphate/aromatic aminotransferase/cobyric acid decarboxylase-like protein|nr:aminotransferase class I/II-fold pyridoxal phosphate-dependent enzyme [Lentimicrobiaceae bacterium]
MKKLAFIGIALCFLQCSVNRNSESKIVLTNDKVKVPKEIYEYTPKDYINQLQDAALNKGKMLDMTETEDEDEFVETEKIIVELAKEYFAKDRNYDYYMKDPYYRSTLYGPFCKFYGLDNFPQSQIFFGCGSYDLWKTLLGFIITKGKIIGNAPQFPDFVNFIKATGHDFEGFYNNDFSFPTKEIIQSIEKEKDNCACILIDRPSNPTGLFCTLEEISLILEKSKQYNIPVVIDEAYANYIPINESVSNLIKQYSNGHL